ncbi:hypothetical protein EGW08_022998, partial [Elysia chlorotica]
VDTTAGSEVDASGAGGINTFDGNGSDVAGDEVDANDATAIAPLVEQEEANSTDKSCAEVNGDIDKDNAGFKFEIDPVANQLNSEGPFSRTITNSKVDYEAESESTVRSLCDAPQLNTTTSGDSTVKVDLNELEEPKGVPEVKALTGSCVEKVVIKLDSIVVDDASELTTLTEPEGFLENFQDDEVDVTEIVKDILNSVLVRVENSNADVIIIDGDSKSVDGAGTDSNSKQGVAIDRGKKTSGIVLSSGNVTKIDAGVIHVLSDKEEDDDDGKDEQAMANLIVVDDDDEDTLSCKVSFSEAQGSLKRRLDDEATPGPSPKVLKPGPDSASQQNKRVCYGDGTHCVECGETFSLQAYFSDHISSHFVGSISALGQCALCGLVFTNSLVMTVHLESAQERMEAAVKLMDHNGSTRKKKPDRRRQGSGSPTPDAEDDVPIHFSGGGNSSASPDFQSPEQSAEKRISPDRELPDGAKRKRKAPQKFVCEVSPTRARRKSRGSGEDPEVEAYLQSLVKQGLTVDPAALGLPLHSPPSKSTISNRTGAKGGNVPKHNQVHVTKNGKVHILSSNTGLGTLGASQSGNFLSWTGQRGRGDKNVNMVGAPALIRGQPPFVSTVPYNQDVRFRPVTGAGNRPRFPQFQTAGAANTHALPPLLPHAGARSLVSGKPVDVPNNFNRNLMSGSPHLPLGMRPELSRKAHFVLRTTLAASPLIKDARIDRLRLRRISRRDSQGCKRVRNVRVRMRRLAMPPGSEGQWPVWRLNPGSSQLPASLQGQAPGRNFNYSNNNNNNSGLQYPVLSQLIQHPRQTNQQVRGRSLNVKSEPRLQTTPFVKLNKVPGNVTSNVNAVKNSMPRPQQRSDAPRVQLMSARPPEKPQNASSISLSSTKEQSRNVVEMMLQSLVNPVGNFQPEERMFVRPPNIISSTKGMTKAGSVSTPNAKVAIPRIPPKRSSVMPFPAISAPKRLIPLKPKPVSGDVIVIDDEDENIGSDGSRNKQQGGGVRGFSKLSSTLSTPLVKSKNSHISVLAGKNQKLSSSSSSSSVAKNDNFSASLGKNVVEVREINSTEPSVIVDMTRSSSIGNLSQNKKDRQDRLENSKGGKDKDRLAVKEGEKEEEGDVGNTIDEKDEDEKIDKEYGDNTIEEEEDDNAIDDQDFCGWKVQVVESPEESEDEGDKGDEETVTSDSSETKPQASEGKSADQIKTGSETRLEGSNKDTNSLLGGTTASEENSLASDCSAGPSEKITNSESEACGLNNSGGTKTPETPAVAIPPHLEDSSNIQDIFSEIEKTCREMQENSEGVDA